MQFSGVKCNFRGWKWHFGGRNAIFDKNNPFLRLWQNQRLLWNSQVQTLDPNLNWDVHHQWVQCQYAAHAIRPQIRLRSEQMFVQWFHARPDPNSVQAREVPLLECPDCPNRPPEWSVIRVRHFLVGISFKPLPKPQTRKYRLSDTLPDYWISRILNPPTQKWNPMVGRPSI